MKNKQFWIIAAVIVALVGVGFYLASKSPATISVPPTPAVDSSIKGDKVFTRSYSHMTGNTSTAKVTLVEFGDFECPVCGDVYPAVDGIVSKYESDPNFNYIFRNFPLAQHSNAQIAAEAAEAAAAQGKYFQMVNSLYTNQNEWSGSVDPVSNFVQYAQQLGLNTQQFQSDVTSYKYFKNVEQDMADANAFGVDATPTFYLINASGQAQQFVGSGNISQMSAQIDSLMATADKTK